MILWKRHAFGLLTALTITCAGLNTSIWAQDNYDNQQWWNPGDWFDEQPQYNLFSDNYWNNHQGYNDTADYGYDYHYEPWDHDYSYDNSYWNPGADYGYYDNWNYDSNYGKDEMEDNNSGVGTTGAYESGQDSGINE